MKAKIKNAEQQTIRKSIESILFANGVKCDEEQFLIEDLERLLETCITPVPDTAHCYRSKAGEQAKIDLKKELVKKLLAEGVQVTMSVAKALDEFIDVDVSDKIESLLEKEKEESFIKGIMAEDDVRDKIRLEMFIKEKTK